MFKKILIAAMTLLCAVYVHGQSQTSPGPSAQNYVTLYNPVGTLANPSNSVNPTTNVINGWTNTTITTNTTTLWNVNSNAFLTTSTYTTNQQVLYVGGSAKGQNYLPLEFDYSCNNNSNVVWQFSRSITGGGYETSPINVTNAGGTNVTFIYQLDMRGYNFWRLYSWTWYDTNGTHTFTNFGNYQTLKLN